jgi:SagB-type dehydrogenase family enzyme
MPSRGEATVRYLRALRERTATPIDWAAAPPAHQRYPTAGRITLPWAAPATPWPPVEPGPPLFGALLRELQGPRTSWVHQAALDPNATGAGPLVTIRRPVPSGGALYPIETYLCAGASADAEAGLYHYDAAHHCLDLIRPGDHRGAVAETLADPPAASPELLLVFAARFWRQGFKYRDFAYRLCCQETGALAAQALVMAEHLSRTASVHLTFSDRELNAVLGLEPDAEAALAVLELRGDREPENAALPTLAELTARPRAKAAPPAPSVTRTCPHLAALHSASSRWPPADPERVTPSRASTGRPGGHRTPLPPAPPIRLFDGIADRASTSHGFAAGVLDPEPVAGALAGALAGASAGYPADLAGTTARPVGVDLYLVALRVGGIAPGAYRYDPEIHALLRVGDADTFAGTDAAALQPNTRVALPEAAAIVLPVGDPLERVAEFGDRWYRMQQIEAGLAVHRATLAATALGLAARIHSDGTNSATDAALGLRGTSRQALSFLLLGNLRPGAVVHTHDRKWSSASASTAADQQHDHDPLD